MNYAQKIPFSKLSAGLIQKRIRTGAAISAGILAVAAGVAAGRHFWNKTTHEAIHWLDAGFLPPQSSGFALEQFNGLPAPVIRYLRFALPAGQALIKTVTLKQAGEIRLGGFSAPWHPFTATHHVSTSPPGFLWDANVKIAPFIWVRVQDSYVQGMGSGRVGIGAPLLQESSRWELNEGQLQRYLAEAVWYPTALLPGQFVDWEAIDDHAARAILTYLGVKVAMDFQFDEKGAIVRSYTPGRYRKVKGSYVLTPWEGHYGRYEQVDGMMVPTVGEVGWRLPEGRLSVWWGEFTDIPYDYAPQCCPPPDRCVFPARTGPILREPASFHIAFLGG